MIARDHKGEIRVAFTAKEQAGMLKREHVEFMIVVATKKQTTTRLLVSSGPRVSCPWTRGPRRTYIRQRWMHEQPRQRRCQP